MNNINESSLSRVWQHFKDKNTTVVILTGFRGDLEKSKNTQRNKAIAADLKNAGYGYFYVDGYWIENKGTKEERKVSEDSIFAITTNLNKSNDLVQLAHKLGNKYNQDAIFAKTPKEVKLIFKDGSSEKLTGGLKPGKLGDFYTKLRNNKKSNTFVFEKERDGKGFFTSFKEYIQEKHLKEKFKKVINLENDNKAYFVNKKDLKNLYIDDFKDGDWIIVGNYTIEVDRKGYKSASLGTKVRKDDKYLNSTPGIQGGVPYFIDDFIGKRKK